MRTHLQRLIMYAQSADTGLQREVAEKLANEAVKRAYRKLVPVARTPRPLPPRPQPPGRSKSLSWVA